MLSYRYSFARLQTLEERCLVPECYTSKQEYQQVLQDFGETEVKQYVEFLERQCGVLSFAYGTC